MVLCLRLPSARCVSAIIHFFRYGFGEHARRLESQTADFASPERIEVAKIFKLVSDLIIEHLDSNPPYPSHYYASLTECMVRIAKLSTSDEELYVLEDMVSPAMWLLEKQSDKKIVANVKDFIRILH